MNEVTVRGEFFLWDVTFDDILSKDGDFQNNNQSLEDITKFGQISSKTIKQQAINYQTLSKSINNN